MNNQTAVTKKQFDTYVGIQHSGVINMFDIKHVILLSNGELTREACLYIMEHYSELVAEFGQFEQ